MEPTGVATAVESKLNWIPGSYTGTEQLEGITFPSTGHLPGQYVEKEGIFLFQPDGSSKVFEVSDEDILRQPTN